MPISKTTTITPFPSWESDDLNSTITRYETLPTPARMRSKTLFGLPLFSAFTREPVSDDALQSFINESISEVEHLLDLYITPTEFTEKHDYNREQFAYSFAYMKLNHPNILQVTSFKITFNNDTLFPGSQMQPTNTQFPPVNQSSGSNLPQAVIDFPLEHIHVMPQEGTIQLVPAFGTSLSGFLLSAFSGVQYHAFQSAFLNNWPGAIRVTYVAGFQKDKIPALLSGLIENLAAQKFLSVMGPIIFPYNSTSVGIDGTSQGVSTVGPLFLRQRLEELEKTIQQQMDAARGYYQRQFLIDWM